MDRDKLKALVRANRKQRLEAEEWQILKYQLQAAEAALPDDWVPSLSRRGERSPEQIQADIDEMRPKPPKRPAHRPPDHDLHRKIWEDFKVIRPHVKTDRAAYEILREEYPRYGKTDSIRRLLDRFRKRTKAGQK